MQIPTHPLLAPPVFPFDPVCGSPLPGLFEANVYRTSGGTYYFCSAMCRRFFLDQRGVGSAYGSEPKPGAGPLPAARTDEEVRP